MLYCLHKPDIIVRLIVFNLVVTSFKSNCSTIIIFIEILEEVFEFFNFCANLKVDMTVLLAKIIRSYTGVISAESLFLKFGCVISSVFL